MPFVALPIFAVRFVRLPVAAKMSYVPDDAFYYMQLGSEFQRSALARCRNVSFAARPRRSSSGVRRERSAGNR